jgi:type IX secretion system PorP/SprF family membrane protein
MKKFLQAIAALMLTLCLWLPQGANGQVVPRYGTYLINGVLLNPAYTGYREFLYANALYHRQWLGQPSAPGFFAMLIDGSLSDAVNLGFQATSEQLGLATLTSASASYAYRIQLSRTSDLSFGLALGAMYGGINQGKVKAVAPEDPTILETSGKAIPHMSAGVYFGSRIGYGGIALRNLSGRSGAELADGFLLAPPVRNIAATLGTFIPITKKVIFRPSIMWQDDLEAASSLDVTLSCIFIDRFWLGLSARTDQPFGRSYAQGTPIDESYSAALLGEVFITDRITLSYAYDMGLDSFSSAYSGGHQISVGYYITQHKNTPYSYRYRFKSHYKSDICPTCIKR